jgi:N-acetylglucosamine kinase-like BadF-type ATPase
VKLALGIDAGGTETRWALVEPGGRIVGEGQLRGFSALQVRGLERESVAATLTEMARAVLAIGRPERAHAGLTGFGGDSDVLKALIASPLGLPPSAVTVGSDIETAFLDLFAPGEGYVVYAGTGSVAAFVDENRVLHRVGGRGVIIDDAGGGYWIAREALREVWRDEEERPGTWRSSALASELFAAMGGADYADTRRYVYEGTRGDVGRLALAVASAADRDAKARAILSSAGTELARLARIMIEQHGPRPVALTGRAAGLHPLIEEAMRAALPGAQAGTSPEPWALRGGACGAARRAGLGGCRTRSISRSSSPTSPSSSGSPAARAPRHQRRLSSSATARVPGRSWRSG